VQTHCHHSDWSKLSEIGPANMVWGSDFPHAESTWPNSVSYLSEIKRRFDVADADLHEILAANPARIFGFDLDALQPVADRIGPDFSS
jgi:predicted TIM-barrel fold metal-dependent hydrolase